MEVSSSFVENTQFFYSIVCTTGRVYNGQTVTQSCIWDSYYDGGGRASMDVTIFYYDSVFPFCGDWVQLWSVRLLDYNWYGF
jgi:hypothetical protein